MTALFDPADPAYCADPYPVYRRLRDEDPVHFHYESGMWIVTRYHDVERALTDFKTFSSSKGNVVIDSPLRVGNTLGSMDPPRHDELRRIIQRALSPSRVEAVLGAVRELNRQRLSELKDKDTFDFVSDFSSPLIFAALGMMLGLDRDSAVEASYLTRNLFEGKDGVLGPAVPTEDFAAIWGFLNGQIEKRTASPADDLFSVLLKAKEDGAPLKDDEIVGNMSTVLMAGNASLGHFFPNIIHALWLHPDQRREVMEDFDLINSVVEETVRWDTATSCFARQVTKDVELSGTTVPAGSRAVIFYASANRDERVIEDPDRFDIRRRRVRHFGFGMGPHICAGSTMARMVCKTLLEDLLPFLGDYEIDIANSRRVHHIMARGFRSLPIVRH